MKKNKLTEFFKGKGYYVLLFVGVLAIAAVTLIGSTLSSGQKDINQNSVDLNEQDNNIAANDNNQTANNNQASGDVANKAQSGNAANDVATKDNQDQKVASKDDIELEGYAEGAPKTGDTAQAQAKTEEPAVAASASTVQADSTKAIESLSFKADDGLLWPVSGNVIMNYSMDHTIYHATLMQYKCNPAVIIGAAVGTKVKAAAVGIVEKIESNNDETGYTITMNIGNDYRLVYGQLNDVKLKVGDKVNEGQIIGSIAEPTKYYSVEGSNLYFEVLKKETTVNPMLLLRGNDEE